MGGRFESGIGGGFDQNMHSGTVRDAFARVALRSDARWSRSALTLMPENGAALYTQMLERAIDRSLSAELDAHLSYGRHAKAVEGARTDTRNGTTAKRRNGT